MSTFINSSNQVVFPSIQYKPIRFCLAAVLLILTHFGFGQAAASSNYSTSTGTLGSTYSWIDCNSGTTIVSGDDLRANVTWPFNFKFYDNTYTPSNNLSVCTNGFIRLDGAASTTGNNASNYDLTSTNISLGQIISTSVYNSKVGDNGGWCKYLVTGTSPNRIFTIEYNNIEIDYNDSKYADVEVSFYETSNKIVLKLGTDNVTKSSVDMGLHSGVSGFFHKWQEVASGTNNAWIEYTPYNPLSYRTKASGNWNAASTWETNDGSGWIDAVSTPSSGDNSITILNGHTVNVTASVSADEMIIEAGGQVSVSSGQTLTIENGTGTDLSVSGILSNSGTITTTGTVSINAGGTYNHAENGGTVITASWDAASNCIISGVTSTVPSTTSFGQSFGNFTWECPAQSATIDLNRRLTTVNGNFTVSNTNNQALILTANTAILNLTVGGDLIVTGTSLVDCNRSTTTGDATFIYLYGNVFIGAGALIDAQGSGYGKIVYSKTGVQTITNHGTIQFIKHLVNATSELQLLSDLRLYRYCDLTVNGTINFGTFVNTQNSDNLATFNLNAGATLITGNPDGITTTASAGCVQVKNRTYNIAANYIYDGSVIQSTGDGLPSEINNFTINNTATNPVVSLTAGTKVNGVLTLSHGRLLIGTQNLTLGAGSISGTFNSESMIVADGSGKVIKNLTGNATFLLPLGSITNLIAYSPVNLTVNGTSFSNAHIDVNLSDVSITPTASDNDYLNRYWTISPTGISNLNYSATFSYVDNDVIGSEESYVPASHASNWTFIPGTVNTSNNTITVTGRSTASSYSAAGKLSVIISSNPAIPQICAGSSIELQALATGGKGPYSYTWTPGGFTTPNITVSPASTTLYTVQVTDLYNSLNADIEVLVSAAPSVDAGPDVNVIQGSPYTVSLASVTGSPILWTTTGEGVLTNENTISPTYTPLSTETYPVVLTLNVGIDPCSDSDEMIIFYTPTAATWTGWAYDNDWNTSFNWDGDVVPGAITDVIIPGGLYGNYPTITSAAACNDITLESDASLVEYGDLTVHGTASVYRDIPTDLAWHFLSSPVSNQGIWPEFAPVPSGDPLTFGIGPWTWDLYYWNPNANLATDLYWVNIRKDDLGTYNYRELNQTGSESGFGLATISSPPELNLGKGYLVAYDGDWGSSLHKFSGNLNTGSLSIPIINGSNPYNLIGNPYPSSLDWLASSGWDRTNLTLNGSGYDYWIWNDQEGAYGAFNSSYPEGAGTHSVDRFIAPTQAFFVQAAATGNLGMDNTIRTHSLQPWLKKGQSNPDFLKLKLTTDANRYSDELVLMFDPSLPLGGTTKWWSMYPEAPELYTQKDGFYYCIDRLGNLDHDVVVDIYTKISTESTYTLTAANIVNFIQSSKVYLEDKKTGIITNLVNTPSYSYTAAPEDESNRFRLLIESPNSIEEPNAGMLNIFSSAKSIYVQNEKVNDLFKIKISDMLGQTIESRQLTGKGIHRIDLNVTPGVYIVHVFNQGFSTSKKVVIQ